MTRLTGGQALVKSVAAGGVETLFALPGVQLDHLFNALHDEGNAIRVINSRHEQGAGYMALGQAMATGGIGAYAVVPGPGVLNTLSALATAQSAGARVLCLTGQIPSAHIGRGLGMLHEVPDQLATLRSLTKWAARIDHPAAAPSIVAEAFRQLEGGAPGPVALEMALDLLADSAEVDGPAPLAPVPTAPVDMNGVRRAAELLGAAHRPLIVVGGGVFGAEAPLRELAEMLQAPVVANRMGRGALPDTHPLSVTAPVGHRLWAEADVVLAVGTRLQPQRMNWGLDDELALIHINTNPVELKRISTPAVAMASDADATLRALVAEVPARNRARPSRSDEIGTLKSEMRATFEAELAPQMAYVDALSRALDPAGVLVADLTQVGYVCQAAFPVHRPRGFISSGYQGTLGYGYATALGVKVARPDVPVLSINGDGGFMYNVQELSTAVKAGIGVVAVVFNDSAYGNVLRMQRELHDGRVIASDLRNPDFVALAESFGAAGYRAETPEALEAAITDAFAQGGPALIDVPVGPMVSPWPLIAPGRVR